MPRTGRCCRPPDGAHGRAPLLPPLLIAAALASGACTDRPSGAPETRAVIISTGGAGGIYHPLGVALAEHLALADTTHDYTVHESTGSVENLQRLLRGEATLAFTVSTALYDAHSGTGPFVGEPATSLRVVAPLYTNFTHVLVAADAPVRDVAGLRGMRVSLGAAGSGTEQVARDVLALYGLLPGDVAARQLPFNESIAGLLDGSIDAAVLSVGLAARTVTGALASGRVRLLPIPADTARRLTEGHPYYSVASIPGGTYTGVEDAVPTVALLNWVVAREDLDPGVARSVLDVLNRELDALRGASALTGNINLSNLYAAPVPLHPAARAWLDRS